MIKFQANKKGFIFYIIISALLPLSILLIDREYFLSNLYLSIPPFLPLLLLVWLYQDTRYWIDNNTLYYQSAFLRGKIDIHNIDEVIIGKTLWTGTKPALSGKGLIIKFNKYDEIYIAPINNAILVKELVDRNPNIKLIEYTKSNT